jgi:uncharacterized protein (TIGR02145 family)
MNCSKCKAEWTPPAGRTITQCPFCGEALVVTTFTNKESALHEMLRSIVQQFGREILGETRLRGLISDLMPNSEKKYLRILKQAVDDGVGTKLLEMDSDTLAVRTLKIAALKENFRNNNALNHTADYVIDCYLYALGLQDAEPKDIRNQAQLNNLEILKQAVEMAFTDNLLTKDESKHIFKLSDKLNLLEKDTITLIMEHIKRKGMVPDASLNDDLDITRSIIVSSDWIQKKSSETYEKHFSSNEKHKSTTSEARVRWKTISYKADENDEKYRLIVGHDYTVWIAQNDGVTKEGKTVKKGDFFIFENDIVTKSTHLEEKKSGITYESVKIGNQVWMKRNLDVSHFRNGDVIPEVKTNKEWERAGKEGRPAWCYYDNNPENGKNYGKLYNWYAVNDPRGLAPDGWHVPSDAEWDKLINYLGGFKVAGGKMKTTGTTYWKSPNAGATNSSGFLGLPGGGRYYDGNFYDIGGLGSWWTSTEDSSAWAYYRDLDNGSAGAGRNESNKELGFSVRCHRD